MPDISWNSPYTGSSEAVTNVEVLWITDSVFVVCWINESLTTAYASVYDSDGSHLHSQSLFSDSFYQYHQIQLAKVRDNMWVLAYSEDSGFYTTRLRSLTWTGSSITDNGQIATLNLQQTMLSAVCNEGEDKISLWGRRFDIASVLYCKYGTYNGSSWSWSSDSAIIGNHYADEIRACTAANNKGFLLWDKDPADDTKCHGFTTTAGGDTDVTSIDGTDELRHLHCCRLADNKIIITGHSPDSPGGGRAYAISITNNKPTVGTRLVFNPDNVSWNPNCSRIDDTHVLIAFEDATDSGKGKTVLCEVDFDTLTIIPGDTEIFSSNDIGGGGKYGLGTDSNSEGKIALAYRDESDNNYLKVIIGEQITLPSTPTRFMIVESESGDSEITLSWDLMENANYYDIYYSTNTGVTKESGTKIGNIIDSTYSHQELDKGTYYYIIYAINEEGESVVSDEISGTVYFDGKIFDHDAKAKLNLLQEYQKE